MAKKIVQPDGFVRPDFIDDYSVAPQFGFSFGFGQESETHWTGYGRFCEGVHYRDCPHTPGTRDYAEWIAGWNRALTEGKSPPKSPFESKTMIAGAGVTLVGLLAMFQEGLIANNPDIASVLGVGIGYLMMALRLVTDKPLTLARKG